MQSLSSSVTPFTKFALPGVFLAGCPTWTIIAMEQPRMIAGAIIWPFACVFLLWWTSSIKKVALADGQFVISNYLRETSVPTMHLVRVHEERCNRTPSITLFFDPPTTFGRRVRIIPPVEFLSHKEFDRIAALLHQLLAERKNA